MPVVPDLVVGDALQPDRYRGVLRDAYRFLSAIVPSQLAEDTARRLLLHADGLAGEALAVGRRDRLG